MRLLQIYLSEANYRDRDQVDLYIGDLSLIRYTQPTLLEFAPERAVQFADAKRIPVHLRLAGVQPGARVPLTCELSGGGRIVARAAAITGRGPRQLSLDVGPRKLAPGTYKLIAGWRTARPPRGRECGWSSRRGGRCMTLLLILTTALLAGSARSASYPYSMGPAGAGHGPGSLASRPTAAIPLRLASDGGAARG